MAKIYAHIYCFASTILLNRTCWNGSNFARMHPVLILLWIVILSSRHWNYCDIPLKTYESRAVRNCLRGVFWFLSPCGLFQFVYQHKVVKTLHCLSLQRFFNIMMFYFIICHLICLLITTGRFKNSGLKVKNPCILTEVCSTEWYFLCSSSLLNTGITHKQTWTFWYNDMIP